MARLGLVSTLLLILLITWHLIAQPLHNSHISTSSAAIASQTQEDIFSSTTSDTINTPILDTSSIEVTHHAALAKRGEDNNPVHCKFLQRHQHSVIYPSVLTVNALVGFWQKVALETIYRDGLEAPKTLFTFTQGQLQATFSCLGSSIPWKTVQEVAFRVIQSVNMGWVDTFDAIYEEARGAFTFWVSFQVLENKLKRKRNRPG